MEKQAGIFGAGQAGVMLEKWLPADQILRCYIDNHPAKQGTKIGGIPVYSLNEALGMKLDVIVVAVLNRDAAKDIAIQIRESGFSGEVMQIQTFRERQDIRLAAVRLLADEIKNRGIPGEMAELGVYQGELAKEMNRLLPDRKLYLFDTFEGFSEKDIAIERELGSRRAREKDFSDTSMELVRKKMTVPEQVIFCKGYFPDSLKKVEHLPPLALVSLDPDLYEPVYQGLCVFYPLLSPGGVIVIHDYNSVQFPGVKKAVRKYCEEQGVFVVPLMDLHGSAVLIKQG
ncbi:MAG: TylF/MycF/NovP-related O-methyltransferase [Brotaphodocola sp.]